MFALGTLPTNLYVLLKSFIDNFRFNMAFQRRLSLRFGSQAQKMFKETPEGRRYVSSFLTQIHDILPVDQPPSIAKFLNDVVPHYVVRSFSTILLSLYSTDSLLRSGY